MRGEYGPPALAKMATAGSPPHAWGIRNNATGDRALKRITPTCVGNTPDGNPTGRYPQDHPHMRGEYYFGETYMAPDEGSPPHAWGIRLGLDRSAMSKRITPTCVGNTHKTDKGQPTNQDHPHMRGEYVEDVLHPFDAVGITPTCVGNTWLVPVHPSTSWDHPHVMARVGDLLGGSPPHAWGILAMVRTPEAVLGITPTCVGNT